MGSISNLIGAAAAANPTDLSSLISNNYSGGLAGLASAANPVATGLGNSLLTNSAAFGGAARGGKCWRFLVNFSDLRKRATIAMVFCGSVFFVCDCQFSPHQILCLL